MRHKNVGRLLWAVVAFSVMLVVLFAVVRYGGRDVAGGDAHGHGEHEHEAVEQGPKGRGSVAVEMEPAGDMELSGSMEDGVRVVEVTAKQFEFEPSRIVVRAGEPVELRVRSIDVTHGIMLGEFDINRTLEPNKTETITFTPEKAGTYPFQCSVYCGRGHTRMDGELVVVEPEGSNE